MSAVSQVGLAEYFDQTSAEFLDRCTRCGRCVEVCPVAPFADLLASEPGKVVEGVLRALEQSAPLDGASLRWSEQCTGCGDCIPVCPEAINPRQMVMLATARHAKEARPTPHLFRKMARAIRLMAAMQLLPEDLRRLLQPAKLNNVDIVFYTGCNAVRAPHVLFNAMYVLDALDVQYEVLGGPSSCCGVIHSKWEGDLKVGGQITEGAIRKFANFEPKRVLNWCPSCQLHLGETVNGYREMNFDFNHITKYLVEREDDLVGKFVAPVKMKVMLHAHEGMSQLGDNVARLLKQIPGLIVADTVREGGYTCGGSGVDRSPKMKAKGRADTIRRAAELEVDAVVSLFHGCHLQLAGDGREHGFEVLNFTDLLVRALGGQPRNDALEAFRALGDWHEIARQASPKLAAHGINMTPEDLASVLPEVFSTAEFRGGLQSFVK